MILKIKEKLLVVILRMRVDFPSFKVLEAEFLFLKNVHIGSPNYHHYQYFLTLSIVTVFPNYQKLLIFYNNKNIFNNFFIKSSKKKKT